MEYIVVIGFFLILFGLGIIFCDNYFNLTSSIICIVSILIGFVMTLSLFFYNRRIEKQFDEILSKNESIIIIETKTNNDDILKRVMKNYYNYEVIYKGFVNKNDFSKTFRNKIYKKRFI